MTRMRSRGCCEKTGETWVLFVVRVVDLPYPRTLWKLQLDFFAIIPLVVEAAEHIAASFVKCGLIVEHHAGSLDIAKIYPKCHILMTF